MTDQPLFSIVIPIFNPREILRDCLDSITQQTFQDFEVLIIDGGEEDKKILSIVAAYQNKSFDCISLFREPDKGVYDAMNKGIDKAKGKWLYFIGADDVLFDNEVLEDISKYVLDCDNALVYGDSLFKNHGFLYDGEFTLQKLLKEKNICHQSIFYNAAIFKLIGKYNLRYPILADYDFNLRCFRHPDFKIQYVPRTVAVYNDIGGLSSLSTPATESFLKEIPLMRQEKLEEMEDIIRTDKLVIEAYKNSLSYRIGFSLLKPFRIFKKIVKGLQKHD